jgi:DNA-binding transcriptional LysR family regulator
MSEILARLRRIFGDPLLVRAGQGMAATPRGLHVATQAREALRLLEAAVAAREPFEANGVAMDFRIVLLASLAFSLIPKLVRDLESKAPGVRLLIEPADVRRTREMLEANECDMVIGYPPTVSSGLHAQALFRLQLSCIARQGHPTIAGKVTLDDYLALPHAVLGAGASPVSTIEATVERALRRRRRTRKVALRTPDLLVSTAVVAQTDLLATVPTRLAHTFADMLKLQVLKLPFPMAVPNILMIWHERTHRDPGHRFLRQAVRDVGREFDAVRN